jgi:hypothetical protein
MIAPVTTDQIRALQASRRNAGISDDDWRAKLRLVSGQESTKGLTTRQANALLDELAPAAGRQPFRKSEKAHVRKVYALWTEAGRVGAVDNANRPALRAFIARQLNGGATLARDPEFLTPVEANKVSEGLKAMIKRAGV